RRRQSAAQHEQNKTQLESVCLVAETQRNDQRACDDRETAGHLHAGEPFTEDKVGKPIPEQRYRLEKRRHYRRLVGLQSMQVKQRCAHIENARRTISAMLVGLGSKTVGSK